jgi:hypothetical protein
MPVSTSSQENLKEQALEYIQSMIDLGTLSVPSICGECGMFFPIENGVTPLHVYFYRGFLPQFWTMFKWLCPECLRKRTEGPSAKPWYLRINLPPPPSN